MIRVILTVVAVMGIAAVAAVAQGSGLRLQVPVDGVLGLDYWILYHVDHDSDTGRVRDPACGTMTYDGHHGTDFVIPSFRHMDSGVRVLAAAAGVVQTVVDSLPDRNKRTDRSLGFGNYIAIAHSEGVITYYAHLRKGSALVAVGDSVRRGQPIGLVGSSGTSEDPHLHFEVWGVIDPFVGACGQPVAAWERQPPFDRRYALVDADITTWPPLLDTLRERPPASMQIGRADTSVTFWSLQRHVDSADQLSATWFTPDNDVWFSYASIAGRASSYYYWWTWIRRPSQSGLWRVEYRRNDSLVALRSFMVEPTMSAPPRDAGSGVSIRQLDDVLRLTVPDVCQVRLYDLQGRLLQSWTVPYGTSAIVAHHRGPALIEVALPTGVLARMPLLLP
jgi:hypothetical protein